MFLRRLFYGCAAILCLALTCNIGPGSADAQMGMYFRVLGPGGFVSSGESVYLVNDGHPPNWTLVTNPSLLPVPVSTLVYYDGHVAITDAGEGFVFQSDVWNSLGMIPGGATSVQPTTWGALKTKFK